MPRGSQRVTGSFWVPKERRQRLLPLCLAGVFRLRRPDRCPVRILRVYDPPPWFSGHESESKRLPLSSKLIPALISNGKTGVIYGNE
jgi:hypothetical protein